MLQTLLGRKIYEEEMSDEKSQCLDFKSFENLELFLKDSHLANVQVSLKILCFIKPVWLNGCVFSYEVSSCGFESCCSHLNLLCFIFTIGWERAEVTVLAKE